MPKDKLYSILSFDELSSTNAYGMENFHKLQNRTVILAKSQTNGRGRFERKWFSPPDINLYFSIILKSIPQEKIINLTQFASLTMVAFLRDYKIESVIKWPNDIIIDGEKICGILSESVLRKNTLCGSVLGIGLNVNMQKEHLINIDQPATSMYICLNKVINLTEALNKFLKSFFLKYEDFIEKGFEIFYEEYKKNTDFIGKKIKIFKEGQALILDVVGIEKNGALRVAENGIERTIFSGDIIV